MSEALVKNTYENDLPEAPATGRALHQVFYLPRLSSPIEVWKSFIRYMDEYGKIIKAEGYTWENREKLKRMEEGMQHFFDMREVPPSVRLTSAIEASIYLRESIAKFSHFEFGMLPNRDQAFAEMRDGYPGVWSLDDSLVSIVYIDGGEFRGNFQFSPQSLAMAKGIYEATRDLSYMDPSVDGLYESYFLTPGPLIPDSWIHALPSWMNSQLFDLSVWQWACVVFGFIAYGVIVFYLAKILYGISREWSPFAKGIVRLIVPLASILMIISLSDFLAFQIFVSGYVLRVIRFVEWLCILASTLSAVFIIGSIISDLIIRSKQIAVHGIDSNLIRFGVKVGSLLVATAIAIEGATMLGFSFATVVAGAGVTGLALALAAQESLRNVFGSVMLLLDKPFTVGQRIIVRGHDGVVEEVGLRSTKMRLLTGHLTSIPNEDMAKADIENIGERQSIRNLFRVSIPYDTPPDKINQALEIVRNLLAVDENDPESVKRNTCVNHPDFPPRVYFEEFSASSLSLLVIFWYHPPEYWEYRSYCEWLNLEIVKQYDAADIQFALPAQTTYLAGDTTRPVSAGVYELEVQPERD
ncbi:mechanosensitive ion channel family protein [Rubellicoccus peritrichatus]|uniref:Mechanosensitive ion channel family protein n=1 Tax=Rubellicoccus peritrichatus TaxID=3080537 RepID=A0AAQ3LC75_9BACT|nr:mechanosensitive ion channel family protein [Puniceicoccus sp. CR14]WOO42672.1 mechanosensitive ion channel family protein [Puniceicoccus sp. CR14]